MLWTNYVDHYGLSIYKQINNLNATEGLSLSNSNSMWHSTIENETILCCHLHLYIKEEQRAGILSTNGFYRQNPCQQHQITGPIENYSTFIWCGLEDDISPTSSKATSNWSRIQWTFADTYSQYNKRPRKQDETPTEVLSWTLCLSQSPVHFLSSFWTLKGTNQLNLKRSH